MITDARELATAMGALDDADLAHLLAARRVNPAATWRDLFDAAEALLAPAAVEQAITLLPRDQLDPLAEAAATGEPVASPALPSLTALALLRADGTPFAVVAETVRRLVPEPPAPSRQPADPATEASVTDAAAAAERAAEGTAALADLIVACLAAPLSRTAAGGVSAADRKRLVESGVVASAEDLEDLLEIGARAGLLAPVDRRWLVTHEGEQWLVAATAERWRVVAERLRGSLPAALRDEDGAWIPLERWPGAVPLDQSWRPRQAALRRLLERWGLVTGSGAEPAWTNRLRTSGSFDTDALARLLPPQIDRVYVQADLTAIAPGVLAPELDLRLRGMAVRESRAQASTYRFTEESLAAAVAAGETADGIRAFLSELSLTGIPQPLDYLIDRAAARHGLISVRTDPGTGRTRVDSDDPRLLETVGVDHALRPLGLVAQDGALVSRVSRDAVYWTLVDARYPVVATTAAGDPEPLHRHRTAAMTVPEPRERYARLVEALRAGAEADPDAAWLDRELDAAVRTRSTIAIVVALPGGQTREFTLEATGLGGGRLRGRDRGADTERTVPVSSILSVRAV